jgi:hypothetical protein
VEQKPRVLANKVILNLIQHMVSDELTPTWDDYASIRVVFRKCQGEWASLVEGDPQQIELLKNIVTAWGQMPIRKVQLKRVV